MLYYPRSFSFRSHWLNKNDGHDFQEALSRCADSNYEREDYFSCDHLDRVMREIKFFRPGFAATLAERDKKECDRLEVTLASCQKALLTGVGILLSYRFAWLLWETLEEIREKHIPSIAPECHEPVLEVEYA